MDLCFELAALITGRLRGAAEVADETHGFKYFEERDLLGFVDGTENPAGRAAANSALNGTMTNAKQTAATRAVIGPFQCRSEMNRVRPVLRNL